MDNIQFSREIGAAISAQRKAGRLAQAEVAAALEAKTKPSPEWKPA